MKPVKLTMDNVLWSVSDWVHGTKVYVRIEGLPIHCTRYYNERFWEEHTNECKNEMLQVLQRGLERQWEKIQKFLK